MDLLHREWYSSYWVWLLEHNRMLWVIVAAAVLFVFWCTRIAKRR